jgi:hypothetical protein
MAAGKTKPTKNTSAETRAFVVVLEEIRAQNKVFVHRVIARGH